MNCSLDIIITTYNRPEQVYELALELLQFQNQFHTLIIIDSSDQSHAQLIQMSHVMYKKSLHKNQPYQRYLGYLQSTADFVLFLDDDMEIADPDFLSIIDQALSKHKPAGLALNFRNKTEPDQELMIYPAQQFSTILKNKLTGYPSPKPGKIGFCGVRGSQPQAEGKTTIVSGGAFVARRSLLFNNFNFVLFNLFEQKLGMGEDTLIGLTLSAEGDVFFVPQVLFWHNERYTSHYRDHAEAFARRVQFSRLFLSLEYARLSGIPKAFAYLHYLWYSLWRLLSTATGGNTSMLKGQLKGLILSFQFSHLPSTKAQQYWTSEAEQNLS